MKITMVKTNLEKKAGTKTVFIEVEKEVSEITEKVYKNIVDAAPFFRDLGGTETLQKSYTCRGYNVTKITSTSPDREQKTIREFTFE